MDVYRFTQYRRALLAAFEEKRQFEPGLRFSKISLKTGIQATYLTNVFKGRAHFSADQLYLFAHYLGMETESIDYLLLLLEWERSTVQERKRSLKAQIESAQKARLRAKDHLDVIDNSPSDLSSAQYYLDPFHKIVHLFLTVPAYAKEPTKILPVLGLTAGRLEETLKLLEKIGYIHRKSNGGYTVLKDGLHLPEDSPLHIPHQTFLRLQSLDRVRKSSPTESTFASATFSANEDTQIKIHAAFLEFFRKCQLLVEEVKPHEARGVYQINFDLFRWG